MLKRTYLALYLLLLLKIIQNVNGQRTKDKMYEFVESTSGCFRRMNSTHQIGCSSQRGGSVGVVHFCDKIEDLDFILRNGSAGPYVPVLAMKLFTSESLTQLVNSKKIVGLILHPNNETLQYYSHENKCPNNRYSVEGTCSKEGWNPWGSNLLYTDIPFPIFYVEDEDEIKKIRDCFEKFNNFSFSTQKDRSLCSLELNSFMYATTDTPTCQRRSNIATNLNPVKLCDPLGDYNIWGSLFPLVEEFQNRTIPIRDYGYIIVAARMDTTSLFDKTAGAESPVTGMVSLLTTAKLLKEMLPNNTDNVRKNVLFILFNGETYDYIGSQRLLYDMKSGKFPIDLPQNNEYLPVIYPENITLFIELSQISKGSATYVHYLKSNNSRNTVVDFIKSLTENNIASVQIAPVSDSLPPSSLHTFIRANRTLPGLVVANHEMKYHNPFYNSIYDNASNIGYKYSEVETNNVQKYIGDISFTLAKTIYTEVVGENYTGDVEVDYTLVDELFHCYLENSSCKVHKAMGKKFPKTKSPLSLYVGVDGASSLLTSLVASTLAWFIGDVVGINCTDKPKNDVFRYYKMAESIYNDTMLCFRATVNTTHAVSPAFIIEDYDWSSNKYSSWSESTWKEMGVRMFLKPSAAHETMTMAIGCISLIFSFVIVYFIKSRSHILFIPPLPSDPPADC